MRLKIILKALAIIAIFAIVTGLIYMTFFRQLDAVSAREMGVQDNELQYVIRLESSSGLVDNSKKGNRRYIRLSGTAYRRCIFAFYDPPIAINNNVDDIYCFDSRDGRYIGTIWELR